MEINMQSIHFNADAKLLDYIQKKVEKLETFFDRIINADVIMRLENIGAKVQDKVLEVKIHVPGTILLVKETCKTFEEAVDLGTDSLKRQLVRYKEKSRKQH